MNKTNKQKLELLRQKIPVGLQHGLTILEKANGNVDQAEKIFQEELLQIVIDKTGITEEVASKHLFANHLEIELALKSIDEERFTLTERILRKFKHNKEEALEKIAGSIEIREKWNLNSWLDFDKLEKLEPEVFCLVVIMEWLNFESYEGLEIALSFNLDTVINQIDTQLMLPGIANYLRKANERQNLVYSRYPDRQNIEVYIKATNDLRNDDEYKIQENHFIKERYLLIDKLCEIVQKNINKFP